MNVEYRGDADDLNARLRKIQIAALVVGVLGAAGLVIGALLTGLEVVFQSYLFAFIYWGGIALGSLATGMLYYLMGGRWGRLVQRTFEAGAKSLWLVAILFIPIILGMSFLYPWTNPEVAAEFHEGIKSTYLTVPYFIIRSVIYFAIWLLLAWVLTRWSHQPRFYQEEQTRRRFQRLSAIGIILYVLTMTFASIDWLMSLEPQFYSSIFGLIQVTTQVLLALALGSAFIPLLTSYLPLAALTTPTINRDVGAILLTAVSVWAYIVFSQFLIIWAGNLPHEVTWYLARSEGGWSWVIAGSVFFLFFLPFLVLLSLRAKQSRRIVGVLGLFILVAGLFYYYWEIIPAFRPAALVVHWLDIVAPIGVGGIWFAAFLWHFQRTPQLEIVEVTEEETLAHEAQAYPRGHGR